MLGDRGWGHSSCLSMAQTSGGAPSTIIAPALVKLMVAHGKVMSDKTWSHRIVLTMCWLPLVSDIFLTDAKLIPYTLLPNQPPFEMHCFDFLLAGLGSR